MTKVADKYRTHESLDLDTASEDSFSSSSELPARRKSLDSVLELQLDSQHFETPRMVPSQVLLYLREAHRSSDDEIIRAATELEMLDADDKANSVEALSIALSLGVEENMPVAVLSALVSAVINLSSDWGAYTVLCIQRFVARGAVEHLGTILKLHVHRPADEAAEAGLMGLCLRALELLCRHTPGTQSGWLGRLVYSGGVDALCAMPSRFPDNRQLIARAAFLCATIAGELGEPGGEMVHPGLAPLTHALVHSEQKTLVPTLGAILRMLPERAPADGAATHEAAALALSELCISADLAALIEQHDVIPSLANALAMQRTAWGMRAHACSLAHRLAEHGDDAIWMALERSGLAEACLAALEEQGTRARLGRDTCKACHASLTATTAWCATC